jgi:hypothetical protein
MARSEKANRPGSAAAEAAAPAGAAQRENHPPMVDLLALASRSTSHRPSCPKAWRAMPRCRPGLRLPGPLPSRCSHAAPDRSEAPLRRREDRCSAKPVGVARRGTGPTTTLLRPANRSGSRGGSVLTLPVPMPLTTTLPKRGSGPFSGVRHPKVTSSRLGSPVPVGVALSGTEHRLQDASSLVKTCFSIHRVLPRTSSLRTGSTGSSTVHAHVFPERTGPNGCHAQRVLHVGGTRASSTRWPLWTRSGTLSDVISPNACALRAIIIIP